jgi:hypothetical protein
MSKRDIQYLSRWKMRSAPRELVLSDGYPAAVRPAQLTNLMLNGTIPLTLMGRLKDIEPGEDGEFSPADMAEMLPLIDAVVLAVLIDPPVSREGDDDHIAIDDIPFIDKMTIFQEVNRPAAALEPFRPEPDGDADALPAG